MNSKHPAAARFLNNGLFDDLTPFAEIEARISALPTTKEISDAFEVLRKPILPPRKSLRRVKSGRSSPFRWISAKRLRGIPDATWVWMASTRMDPASCAPIR